jgi:hypothetical protein
MKESFIILETNTMTTNESAMYANFNKIIYESRTDWDAQLKAHGYGTYDIDNELSSDNTMVLHDDSTGKMVVVHKGTDLDKSAATDLSTDAFITADLTHISPRYIDAKTTTQKAIERYKDYKHTTTGFSLGGAVSNQIGHELNIESHAFNPGVSPNVFRRNLQGIIYRPLFVKKESSKHHIYLTPGDWISNSGALGIIGNEKVHASLNKKGLSPHSIENFT